MKNIKDLTVMVLDHGLFCEQAARMARDVKRVLYYVPNDADPFPLMNASMIGHGVKGIEVVEHLFGDHFKEVDLFCFFDTGFGDLQRHLLSLGKVVWGSRHGEEMELDREMAKEIMKEVGMPVGRYEVVMGMTALRKHLKLHKNVFVKVSKFRGLSESFHSADYKSVEPHLDEIEFRLGPLKELIEFNVEEAIDDCCECGSDTYCIDGKLPSLYMTGYEIKDAGYIGVMLKASDLPKPLSDTDAKMARIFRAYGYRGFFSTEVRAGKNQVPYLIDITARIPNPPGALYSELYSNFTDIIWSGANGILIDPEPVAKYGVQLQIKSSWSDSERWQPIDFDMKYRQQIKICNPCVINGRFYTIPLRGGIAECGAVIGYGDTADAAIAAARKAADTVGGYAIKINTRAIDDAKCAAAEARQKYGIDIKI